MLTHRNTAEQNDAIVAAAVAEWREARSGGPLARTAAICSPLDIIRDPRGRHRRDTVRLGVPVPPGRSSRLPVHAARFDRIDQRGDHRVDRVEPEQRRPPDDSATLEAVREHRLLVPDRGEGRGAGDVCDGGLVHADVVPGRVAEFMHLLGVQRSRRREQYLLGKFDATASAYTFAGTYGALPSLIQAVATLLPQLLYVERGRGELRPGAGARPLRQAVLRRDEQGVHRPGRREGGAGLGARPERHRPPGLQGGEPVPDPAHPGWSVGDAGRDPRHQRGADQPSGAYIYGSTGEESTGWQTDPQLARQNRQQAFSAEWLISAKPTAGRPLRRSRDRRRQRVLACTTAFGTGTYSGSDPHHLRGSDDDRVAPYARVPPCSRLRTRRRQWSPAGSGRFPSWSTSSTVGRPVVVGDERRQDILGGFGDGGEGVVGAGAWTTSVPSTFRPDRSKAA